MIITHFNKQHFKIQLGDLVLSFNPVSKDSKLDTNKYGADVVFTTTNISDYNGGESMSYGEKKPFIVSGPGEYEVQNIFIKGFGTYVNLLLESKSKEKTKLQNTSYVMTVDGMKICFLGCLKEDLSPEQKEIIDEVDILFVPVSSNEDMLNAYDANKLATKLGPKLVIPMDYDDASLKLFLKESGSDISKIEKIEKLTIKRKDIDEKQGEVILFKI
ncbi:MAG: MBL fold metallo-hydrolase [Candidatus Pacebacteria bacterium]|nr:MBL fold metallo-hydrolase [Candidatus Paceibacterota bacterium]